MTDKIFRVKNKNRRGEVLLYADIGGFFGVSTNEFIDQIKGLGDATHVDLRVSSEGGDVITAVDMFNAIRRHPAQWTAHIDGLAASAASFLVLAADEVHMADNAEYMIHRAHGLAMGTADDLRKQADVWEDIEDVAIVSAYVKKTGLNKTKIIDMMNEETWMNAKRAQDLGFVDHISGDMELAASVRLSGRYEYRNAPRQLTSKKESINIKSRLANIRELTQGITT